MDVTNRQWWVRYGDKEEGPLIEDEFQTRLRAGEFPLSAEIKSNFMSKWESLLKIVSSDETFRRPSTMPPPEPQETSE